jgi:hypothetical protein
MGFAALYPSYNLCLVGLREFNTVEPTITQ